MFWYNVFRYGLLEEDFVCEVPTPSNVDVRGFPYCEGDSVGRLMNKHRAKCVSQFEVCFVFICFAFYALLLTFVFITAVFYKIMGTRPT